MPHVPITRLVASAAMAACLSGCAGKNPTAADGELLVAGARSEVVLEELQWAGGRAQHATTVIDSATARYTFTTCGDRPLLESCPIDASTQRGEALASSRDRLFSKASAANFRALRTSYPMPDGVRPPDYAAWAVTVTAGGRRRTITWERGATIPAALSSFACALLEARGVLISCAN